MKPRVMSFDKVREIMNKWIKKITNEWDNNHFAWKYFSECGNFHWECFDQSKNETLNIGASIYWDDDTGSCIKVWTGTRSNVIISISPRNRSSTFRGDLTFNEFSQEEMYSLFKLFDWDVDDWVEENTNEHLEKDSKYTGDNINYDILPGIIVKPTFDLNHFEIYKAYTVYDRYGVEKQCLLSAVSENKLMFMWHEHDGINEMTIELDEYLSGKFTIKPMIVKE